MNFIIDAHEDLAWNMTTFQRDYTQSALTTRKLEASTGVPTANGDTMLGWPEYMAGHVAIVFSTLFASPVRMKKYAWVNQCYADTAEANRIYKDQLFLYEHLAQDHHTKFCLIRSRTDLDQHMTGWKNNETLLPDLPVGLVLLMEGAEAITSPGDLDFWWEHGVRMIGPAWAGNRFCGGTGEPGPLTREGHTLLKQMAALGFILDISHMDGQAAGQALETYQGQVIASHANASTLIKNYSSNRHLSDTAIKRLAQRDAIMGIIPYNRFLDQQWQSGPGRAGMHLSMVAEQVDYVCQLVGDSLHVGIGSDFDGGFGLQSTPIELETIADLQKLEMLLLEKGYDATTVAGIFGNNWLHMLESNLR